MPVASAEPRRIYSFPHWTDNPFVNLLYLDAQSQGWRVVDIRALEHFLRAVSESTSSDVIHIHWTSPVVQRGVDSHDAVARRRAFEKAVGEALHRGTQLVWSIHNVLPHDVRYLDEEIALCQFLAVAARRIHVLSSQTQASVGDRYPLDPEKVRQVRHSSYWGVYDQSLPRDEARAAFGLGVDDRVIGFLGQVRPYKGAETLIRAVEKMQSMNRSLVLMVGGKARADEVGELDVLFRRVPRLVRATDFVPERELPQWLRTFDVMALPYRAVLNSGSVALAATFGVPVVTPKQSGFVADLSRESWLSTYDAAGGDAVCALANALGARLSSGSAPDADAEQWARVNTPYEMAKAFTDEVLSGL